jgi:hypothetical protein
LSAVTIERRDAGERGNLLVMEFSELWQVPADALGRRIDVPLARLGAGRPAAVLLESDGRSVVLSAAPRGEDAS